MKNAFVMKAFVRNMFETSETKAQRLATEVSELLQENNLECLVEVVEVIGIKPSKRRIVLSTANFVAYHTLEKSLFKRHIHLKKLQWTYSHTNAKNVHSWITIKNTKQMINVAKESQKNTFDRQISKNLCMLEIG